MEGQWIQCLPNHDLGPKKLVDGGQMIHKLAVCQTMALVMRQTVKHAFNMHCPCGWGEGAYFELKPGPKNILG